MAVQTPAGSEIRLDFDRKPFYTTLEVATILGISDTTVLQRIHDQELFAVQVGKRLYRIPLGALLQFLGARPSIRRSADPHARVDAKRDDPQDGAEHRER